MNKLAPISAITIAASAGLATAGSLDLDRSYASELRSDAGAYSVLNSNAANLEVTAGARFGYGINLRDNDDIDSDNETTIGFGFEDVEVRLSGQVTDSINATISFDFGPGDGVQYGSFFSSSDEESVNLEDAYADWMVNDGFTLRIGQFVQAFSAGRSISEYHMMGAYRSSAQEVLGDTGWTQGIEAHFGGDTWSGVIGFNDGPFTGNSAFNSSMEADFAFNGRFDFFSDADKARFNDRTSWRGASNAWRLGAGAFWASYGNTNPVGGNDGDVFGYTIDAAYESDGWAVYGAFLGQHVDFDGSSSVDNFGFELGGSLFFNDQFEGFARYDLIIFDEDFIGTEDTFNAINAGINYYFVPESHAAKFTAELGWAFDDTRVGATPIDNPSLGGGFLGNSDGELNLAFMFQFMF